LVKVHQEADAAELHAVHRQPVTKLRVQRAQHEAVAAQRDDDVSIIRSDRTVAFFEFAAGRARLLRRGRDEGEAWRGGNGARDVHHESSLFDGANAGSKRLLLKVMPGMAVLVFTT